MLLLAGAVVGLLAGLVTGGSFHNLLARRLRWPLIVILAFAVKEVLTRSPLGASALAPAVFVVSLAVLIGWAVWHRDELPGMWLVVAGMGLNLAVILANGGRMPVVPAAARSGPPQLRELGVWAQYTLAGPGTRLPWLGDWLFIPGPPGRLLTQAYSPGDLVSLAGLVLVLFLATRPGRAPVPAPGAITSR